MELQERKKDLSIPSNASDREDYIQGIGSKEVGIMGIALICLIIYVIVIFLFTGNIAFAAMSAIFILCIVFMVIKRDLINENLIDKLRILIRYIKTQKKYKYHQHDVFESRENENGK